MPELRYFNGVRGRGEQIKILFAELDKSYKNKDYDFFKFMEDKAKGKHLTTFNQLPELQDGQHKIAGSVTIMYYIARKHKYGLTGAVSMSKALMLAGTAEDIRQAWVKPLLSGKDTDKTHFKNKVAPRWFEYYEKVLSSKNKYFFGKSPTFGDVAVFEILDAIKHVYGNNFDKFKKLTKFYSTMANRPKIKKYLESRDTVVF